MKHRLLSVILILILCFTLTPVSVMAEDESGSQGQDPETFTVTFDFDTNASKYPGIDLSKIKTPATVTNVAKGSTISRPDSPTAGQFDATGIYYFSHWETRDTDEWNFETDTVDANITLYAVWRSKYNVVHEKISESGQPYTGTVEYRDADGNVKYTLQRGDNDGKYADYFHNQVESGSYYLYIGGVKIGSEFNPGAGGNIVSNPTELFHVHYNSNDQEFTDATKPEDILCYATGFTKNNKIAKPATTPEAKNSAYAFAGWTIGPEADSEGFDFSKRINADTTIYAQWIKVPDASVVVIAENSKIQGSRTVKKGQDYTATLVPNTGYELPYHEVMNGYDSYTYVKVDGKLLDTSQYSFDCNTGKIRIPGEYVTGNILIHTVPKQGPYLVTFTNNGGSGTQDPIRVYGTNDGYDYEKTYGMNYFIDPMPKCTITPPDGKIFKQWSNGKNPGDLYQILGNTEIYPEWEDAPDGVYTVSYDLTNCSFEGSVNTTAGKAYTTKLVAKTDYRQPFSLAEVSVGGKVLPSSDYTFDKTTGELTIPAEKITGNITIKASATKGYHVILQQEGGGSVSASSELAVAGEDVTLTASASTGYVFRGWQVVSPKAVTINENNSFKMPAEDVTVKAIFEPQIYSGTCGENLTWTLNAGTGVLSIDGAGAMTSAPWRDHYRDLIKTVKISEGVTSLWSDYNKAQGAFAGCVNLTSVEIPDGITELGSDVFRECKSLENITIPEGVTSIGNSTFVNCTSLNSITLPGSLKTIRSSAFFNCKALSNVYFEGTQQQWNAITIEESNDALTNATLHILRHTVKYDAKGGEDAPADQIKTSGEPLTLSSKIPDREGYTFFGWSTESDAIRVDYKPGDKFAKDEDTTLYAVWKKGIYKIEASPETLQFDSRLEGYTSLPEVQTVTVTNTGNQETVLQQPTAQNYELGQLSQTTLKPGEKATFTVQPKSGLEAGTYEEPITVTTTDGISTEIAVKFTVEKPHVTPEQPGDKPGEKPGKPGTSGTPGQTPAGNQDAASLTSSSALQNPEQKSAQTGDESNMNLWLALLFLGTAGAAGSILYRRKY